MVQVKTGLWGNFLLCNNDRLECLATNSWFKLLWEYSHHYQVTIELGDMDIPIVRQGDQVLMELVDGPFSHLEGVWDFTPLGDGTQRACKVEFTLTYGFASQTLATLVGPVFDKIAGSLVDAFVKRADQVYGSV